MNLNVLKNKQTGVTGILLIAVSLWMSSCRGTDNPIEGGNQNSYTVKINMLGITDTEEAPAKSASANKTAISSGIIQNSIINIDNNNYITASLIPQNATLKNTAQASLNTMAATPVTTLLGDQVKYKVAVYDESGAYVDQKEFSYKQNDMDGFMLNGDHNYTFVAYSVNSTSSADTPGIVNNTALSTAKLANISKDLMYFKKNMTVSGNQTNYLDVVLKHQFSKVTTILDARQVGTISAVTSTAISPAKTSADISFSNSALSYNADVSGGAAVSFPTLNSQYATSTPTQVISPTNPNGELNIGAITIDGVAKNNLKITNVKLDPGVKYDLRVRFGPCREDVSPATFNLKDGVTQTFNMPASDFGFVFDLYSLDNSFDMTINGVKLTTKEIQFNDGGGRIQNIIFADGTKYQYQAPGIWLIKGDAARPMIKVIIEKDGAVSFFGSKNSYQPLLPLKLYNGTTLNPIVWNTTGTNTVTISQTVDQDTYMTGKGTGKRIITCTNP